MKQAIILFGAPGSGKGTQANLIADRFDLYHLETSKVLEKAFQQAKKDDFVEIQGKKYFIQDEEKRWKDGKLNSTPFVLELITEKAKQLAKEERGIVFSSSPRNLEEGENLMPLLKQLYDVKVFFLELSLEQSIWRNSHRRICQLGRHPILHTDQNNQLSNCPIDGSELVKRSLDDPKIIEKRFEVFKQETFPLVDFFQKSDFSFHAINGEQSVAQVFLDITNKI